MKIRLFAIALAIALMLGAGIVLLVHPTHAKSDGAATEVHVDNFSFTPETLTVPRDSTVTWVNKDDVPHVIASNDGLFKSKGLDTDDKYSYTFTKAGTYSYYCSIHPKMVGKIVVR